MSNIKDRRSIERSIYKQKASLYIGNYSEAISFASAHISKHAETILENTLILYRARLSQQQYDIVLGEIESAGDEPIFKVVKLYTETLKYLLNREDEPDEPLDSDEVIKGNISTFDGWLVNEDFQKDTNFLFFAERFYSVVGDTRKAFRCCYQCSTLDLCHSYIVLCLSLYRLDEAEKGLEKMKSLDELCLMTQLTEAKISILYGKERSLSSGLGTCRHIVDKYGKNVVCSNLVAISHMRIQKWETAQKSLVDAWAKEASNGTTLSNLCVCESNLNNLKKFERYWNQLKTLKGGDKELLKLIEKKDAEFDKCAQMFR